MQPIALICTLLGAYILARLTLKKSSWVWSHDYGAKYFIVALLLVSFFGAQGEAKNRFLSAFRINLEYDSSDIKISAWVVPPTYVEMDEIEVNLQQPYSELSNTLNSLTVPEGSQIKVNVEGSARRPRLSTAIEENEFFTVGKNSYSQTIKIRENTALYLSLGGSKEITWNITVEADKPPSIAFTSTPRISPNNTLEIGYLSQDDYPIRSANFHFRKFGTDEDQIFTHSLSTNRGREGFENYYYLDLTASPLAGTMVMGWLTIEDAIGQLTKSELLQFPLPKKTFSNPVAQNIINIRKSLLLGPAPKEVLSQRLKIQAESREEYDNDYVVYMALRTAYWRLNFSSPTDTKAIADILWETALRLEREGEDHLALN